MSLNLSELGKRQQPSDIARLMSVAIEHPNILSLAAGFTDNASLPLGQVSEIVAGMAADPDANRTALQYGSNQGRAGLRVALRKRLEAADGVDAETYGDGHMFVTTGSQQGLYLALLTLCDPGDIVLVEQPTYFVFLEILKGLGIQAEPIPMREDGDVDTAGLKALLEKLRSEGLEERVKALYLVSYFANPTGHSVSENAKRAIGRVLKEADYNLAVIEDAAYRELYFETPFPARSCLALPEFAGMSVLYSSTLTKPYASGLKVGYGYCNDSAWLGAMLAVKGQQDFGTSHFTQAIVEKAIVGGGFDEHLVGLRKIYGEKMRVLDEGLRGPLGELGWTWSRPTGGLYLWLNSPDGERTDFDSAFQERCLKESVIYVPGELCHGRRERRDQARLSFGVLGLEDLREAGRRFARAAAKRS